MEPKRDANLGACAAMIAFLIATALGTFAASAGAQAAPPDGQTAPAAPAVSAAQVPQPDEGGVNWSGVGYGAASVASNVVYIPAKLTYAILGGFVGGASYLLTAGNSQTADTIWRSALGGDYAVTPAMLQGEQPLHFSGPTTTSPESGAVQPIPPSSSSAPVAGAAAVSSTAGGLSETGAASAAPASPTPAGAQPAKGGAAGTAGMRGAPPRMLPDTSIE